MARDLFAEAGIEPIKRDLFSESGINDSMQKAQEIQSQHPYLYKLAEMVSRHPGLSKGIEAAANITYPIGLGAAQGIGDVSASIGNIALNPLSRLIGKDIRLPHPQLEQNLEPNMRNKLLFGLGQLGAQIPAYLSGEGLIAKVLGQTGARTIGSKAATGTLSGLGLGENKEGEGRVLSGALGGLTPIGLSVLGKSTPLNSKMIAKDVLKGMESTEKHYNQEFNSIFNEAKNRNIAHVGIEIPKFNYSILKKGGSKDYLHSLNEFKKNPTLENAHNAQSDLGKYASSIGRPSNTLEREAKDEALNLSDKLRESMMNGFSRNKSSDLALKYNNARKGYKEEYIPYLNSKSIKALKSGDLRPSKFATKIANEEKFMSKIGQYRHPMIGYREKLLKVTKSKPFAMGIGFGAGELGLHELKKFIGK